MSTDLFAVVCGRCVIYSSSTYSPTVANLNCPGAGTCDISFTGFTVKNPSGTSTVLCSNIDDSSSLGLTCRSVRPVLESNSRTKPNSSLFFAYRSGAASG